MNSSFFLRKFWATDFFCPLCCCYLFCLSNGSWLACPISKKNVTPKKINFKLPICSELAAITKAMTSRRLIGECFLWVKEKYPKRSRKKSYCHTWRTWFWAKFNVRTVTEAFCLISIWLWFFKTWKWRSFKLIHFSINERLSDRNCWIAMPYWCDVHTYVRM